MQSTRLQYFVADNWPARLWMSAAPIVGVAYAMWLSEVNWLALGDWRLICLLLIITLMSALAGGIGGFIVGWFILGPLYFTFGELNGGPFSIGERVEVLTKKHRGTIACIDSFWQHNTYRLDLRPELRKSYHDIFGAWQLRRVVKQDCSLPEQFRSV